MVIRIKRYDFVCAWVCVYGTWKTFGQLRERITEVNGVKFQVLNLLNKLTIPVHMSTKNIFFSTQINAIYLGSGRGKILEGMSNH